MAFVLVEPLLAENKGFMLGFLLGWAAGLAVPIRRQENFEGPFYVLPKMSFFVQNWECLTKCVSKRKVLFYPIKKIRQLGKSV